MLGVYELRDVTLAIDLFAWAYRRSTKKYTVVMASMGAPDPVRLRYRESLSDAMKLIVGERRSLRSALRTLGLTRDGAPGFEALLRDELGTLEVFNCARYRLSLSATQAWIAAKRPL